MNSILHRHQKRASTSSGGNLTYVNGNQVSPAATEYYDPMNANEDQNHVMIHEPTPNYEPKQHPQFPDATRYVDNSKLAASSGSQRSRRSYPTSVNEDTVLGQQDADVKRSGTWAAGPGTSGPRQEGFASGNHSRHASLNERANTASHAIGPERETFLSKAEMKDAKRLSKIIKAEGKSEDKQLKSGLKELASLQSAQRKASAAETAAVHAQVKAAREEQKASTLYLEAKNRFERAQANLKVCEERLSLTRDNAQKTTVLVRKQAEEVEIMRERKATDDREREVKLANLKNGMLSPQQ